jgi:N-acetyl-beta-hexosaminidase
MCGPSNQQKQIGAQEQSFTNTLQSNYNQYFGNQSETLSKLNNIFTPIAEAGPDQQGFGPQELAALNTSAGEGVGQNYAKATQALNTNLSARGGGNEFLPSGAQDQLKAALASAGANQMSQEQLGITKANYDQGRANFGNATAGLNALAQEYNPNAIAGQTTDASKNAFGDATEIQQMQNQKESAIAGGIASLAMGAATFGAGALTNGGGFSGGLKALADPKSLG